MSELLRQVRAAGRLCAVDRARPATRYATTPEGDYLAYQVIGDGPRDVLVAMTGGLPIDLIWDEPVVAAALRRLAALGRLIMFDPRGFGASGRVQPRSLPASQTWMDDIGTVLDAVESRRATIVCWGSPAVFSMLFAATYPERVERLVVCNAFARYAKSEETPWGMEAGQLEQTANWIRTMWGTGTVSRFLAPNLVRTPEQRAFWGLMERLSAPPDSGATLPGLLHASDVTAVLGSIQAPTLLITREADPYIDTRHSDYLAERIPDARLVRLPGNDHLPFAGDANRLLDEIERFVTGGSTDWVSERVLSTVLFTDIVDSTQQLSRLGDREWRSRLDIYDDTVAGLLPRFRGRLVAGTGDGTLATFDGPARAVNCAQAITEAVSGLGLGLRAGLHTGEIEIRGDDVAGLAVHVAARVCALASAGEILVTRTVTELVAGSGLSFEPHGSHQVKGIDGEVVVFRVAR
jgi:class 3 adenylate cyclase